ncbi:MAG: hypothetical protein ACYDD1_05420 [Caulobacteraceae bacterium]
MRTDWPDYAYDDLSKAARQATGPTVEVNAKQLGVLCADYEKHRIDLALTKRALVSLEIGQNEPEPPPGTTISMTAEEAEAKGYNS